MTHSSASPELLMHNDFDNVSNRNQEPAAVPQLFGHYVRHLLMLTTLAPSTTTAAAADNDSMWTAFNNQLTDSTATADPPFGLRNYPTTIASINDNTNNAATFQQAISNQLLQVMAGGNGTGRSDNFSASAMDCNVFEPDPNVAFEFWIGGVLTNIIGLLGILGNVLSIFILSRPQMRSSINYLLIGLARCDIVLIHTSMLLFGIPAIFPYTGYTFFYHYYIFPNISPFVYPIAMCAQTASIYLTFTVTLERFVAVCHPLRARALCTYGRAKLYVIGCWVFAVLYNLPRFFEVEVQRSPFDETRDVYCVVASDLRSDPEYIQIYIHWLYLIFMYILPFTTLAILNGLIYMQVRRANRERQRLSRTEKREIGLATMLLCVVLVFFMCNILAMVTNILEAFYDTINDYLVKTSNLLVTINSSINFVIYVIFGEKFKRIFLLLFCKGGRRRRKGGESPDGLIQDECSYSNGDNLLCSSRFQRQGMLRSFSSFRNGNVNGGVGGLRLGGRSVRVKGPGLGPCTYYSARDSATRTSTFIARSPSLNNIVDWDRDAPEPAVTTGNGNGILTTSGF